MPPADDVTVTMRSRQTNTNNLSEIDQKGKGKEKMINPDAGEVRTSGNSRIRKVQVEEDEGQNGWLRRVVRHPVYHVIGAVGLIVS